MAPGRIAGHKTRIRVPAVPISPGVTKTAFPAWLRRPADVSRNLTGQANHGGSLQGEVKLAMCSMSRDPRCELTPAQIMQPVQVGDEPPVVPGLGDGVVTGNDLQRSSGSGARGLTDYGRRILSSSSRQAHHDIPRWGRYAGIASLGGNPWTMLNSSSTLLITRNGQDFESPKSG